MPDLQMIGFLFAALALGALCTLVIQWIAAIQRLTSEVTRTSKRIGDLAETLEPAARRVASFSAAAEDSEPDLRRLQLALGRFSESSMEMTDNLARVSKWLGVAVPVLIAAVERFTNHEGRQAGPERAHDRSPPPSEPGAPPPAQPANGGLYRAPGGN